MTTDLQIIAVKAALGPNGAHEVQELRRFAADVDGAQAAKKALSAWSPTAEARAGNPWQDASFSAVLRADGCVAYYAEAEMQDRIIEPSRYASGSYTATDLDPFLPPADHVRTVLQRVRNGDAQWRKPPFPV